MVYGEFFCQAEDGIRDLVRSRGLGDVYKRQYHFRMLKGQGPGASGGALDYVVRGRMIGGFAAIALSLIHI